MNGNWSAWEEWAECSSTCGRGERTRTRRCDNPSPQHDGETCDGKDTEQEACDLGACPGMTKEKGGGGGGGSVGGVIVLVNKSEIKTQTPCASRVESFW